MLYLHHCTFFILHINCNIDNITWRLRIPLYGGQIYMIIWVFKVMFIIITYYCWYNMFSGISRHTVPYEHLKLFLLKKWFFSLFFFLSCSTVCLLLLYAGFNLKNWYWKFYNKIKDSQIIVHITIFFLSQFIH